MLVVLISTFALGADYVSTVFGFKATFPGEVQQSRIEPNDDNFVGYAPSKAWAGQVQVLSIPGMDKTEITSDYMDARLKEIIEGAQMTLVSSRHTTFQGNPAITVAGTLNAGAIDVNMVIVFTQSRNRIYSADVVLLHSADHSVVQPFLDSFELR